MKEAIERMDSGLMFAFSGRAQQAREQFDKSKEEFDSQLGVEQHNITVPGEQELVNELTAEYRSYLDLAADFSTFTTPRQPSGPMSTFHGYFPSSRTSGDWKTGCFF